MGLACIFNTDALQSLIAGGSNKGGSYQLRYNPEIGGGGVEASKICQNEGDGCW